VRRASRLATAVLVGLTARAAAQQPEATSLLGKPLVPPPPPAAAKADLEAKLAQARQAWERTPNDPDSIIWLGRRTAYLGRYRDAIAIFGDGIAKHPKDARLYRHRGHRYITVRRFDDAIRDLRRAYRLSKGKPDQIEPDGMPNARGIPTSTLQSNIRYHLALAHYLEGDFGKARPYWQEDVAAAVNPDMVVASSHWLYMTLRRLGKKRDADRVLEPIHPGMEIIENGSYHRLLLMYKGLVTPDSVAAGGAGDAIQDATVGYGIGNWHLYNGRAAQAGEIFDRILAMPQWAAFGYIAAEAEVARNNGKGEGGRGKGTAAVR